MKPVLKARPRKISMSVTEVKLIVALTGKNFSYLIFLSYLLLSLLNLFEKFLRMSNANSTNVLKLI